LALTTRLVIRALGAGLDGSYQHDAVAELVPELKPVRKSARAAATSIDSTETKPEGATRRYVLARLTSEPRRG
jgi:hypothetical protein